MTNSKKTREFITRLATHLDYDPKGPDKMGTIKDTFRNKFILFLIEKIGRFEWDKDAIAYGDILVEARFRQLF